MNIWKEYEKIVIKQKYLYLATGLAFGVMTNYLIQGNFLFVLIYFFMTALCVFKFMKSEREESRTIESQVIIPAVNKYTLEMKDD